MEHQQFALFLLVPIEGSSEFVNKIVKSSNYFYNFTSTVSFHFYLSSMAKGSYHFIGTSPLFMVLIGPREGCYE